MDHQPAPVVKVQSFGGRVGRHEQGVAAIEPGNGGAPFGASEAAVQNDHAMTTAFERLPESIGGVPIFGENNRRLVHATDQPEEPVQLAL